MNKATLVLLAYPALLASVLLVTNPAHAAEVVAQPTNTTEYTPAKPVFEVVFEQKTPENPMLESSSTVGEAAIDKFGCDCSGNPTLESSDTVGEAAIDKFGCDCSGCRNTVLSLQGKLPIQ